MSIKYTSKMDAVADPQKKFSHSFLGSKTRFESIMVTNPFFDVSHFVFKIDDAKRAKWTFFGRPKNVQN